MQQWQVQAAKAHFSELLDLSVSEGPQIISRHGKEIAAVVPISYLRGKQAQQYSLVDFFALAPKTALPIERDRSPGREVDW